MNEDIVTERRGRVLWITINRPRARNAMKFAMYERLHDLCRDIDADSELRAVVLTGTGNEAFVSGTDISEFAAFKEPPDALEYERMLDSVLARLEGIRIPVIAAVRGACTGGGMLLATACDIRIAAADSRFGFPISRTLGNTLSVANYARLRDVLAPAVIKEMVFLSQLIAAPRALALGYVNEVVASGDDVLKRAAEIAETIAGNAPLTTWAAKEALRRVAAQGRTADDQDLILRCYMSDDFREGMTAFFEKRPAVWTGK